MSYSTLYEANVSNGTQVQEEDRGRSVTRGDRSCKRTPEGYVDEPRRRKRSCFSLRIVGHGAANTS